MPPITHVSPEQRAAQAFQNLLMADAPAAARSLVAPDQLTPQERDAFLKRMGLSESPWSGVYRMLTNPLLIGSLALGFVFPVPSAKNMFKVAKGVNGFTKRFPLLARTGLVPSAWSTFSGTEVPDILSKISRDKQAIVDKYMVSLGKSFHAFEKSVGRSPNAREQVLVSAWLDGLGQPLRGFQGKGGTIKVGQLETDSIGALIPNLERKMGSNLRRLGEDIRGTLDGMWDEVFSGLDNQKAVRAAFNRMKTGKGLSGNLLGALDDEAEHLGHLAFGGKKVPNYFPHRVQRSEEDMRKLMYTISAGVTKAPQYAKVQQRKALTWLGREFHQREYAMLPSLHDLQQVRDLVDPGEYGKVLKVVQARILQAAEKSGKLRPLSANKLRTMELPEMLGKYDKLLQPSEAKAVLGAIGEAMPATYSLKLEPVLSQYVHSAGGTYAWTVKRGGENMVRQVGLAKAAAESSPWARRRAEMLENTYIPIAMGKGTLKTQIKSQVWEHQMNRLATAMEKPVFQKTLGPGLTKYLQDHLRGAEGSWSFLNAQRSMASYFYLSTLGLNPGSAFKNLFQLILTTGPTLGYKTTAKGVQEAMRKSHKYFALRLGPRKIGHEEALRMAYKEYGKAGLASSPVTDEALQNAYRNAYEIASLPGGKAAKVGQKISRAMMSIFTASENAVRLGTFEAAMIHAKRGGMTKLDDVVGFARGVVERTQFPVGPAGTPYTLLDVGSLWKQLTQFPLRTLEFVSHTAVTAGVHEKSVLGINPGTFARMVAGSTIAYELGDMLGIDTGDALIGGAVPTFREWGPLAPLPVVPPMVQLVGSAAMSFAKGDFEDLVRSTPLLIPGGVGLTRVSGMVPPGVPGAEVARKATQWMHKTYADYNAPAPDGRIAVHTGDGALRGYYTPWELVKAGMGVRGGDLDSERELMTTLVKNRDRIREARRSFAEALFANDAAQADAIARDYKARYGHAIPVSEKDIDALQKRRMMTRLEQMVLTLPAEARQTYVDWIAQVYGANTESFLGVDPAYISLGGIEGGRAREQSRRSMAGPSPQRAPVPPYLNELDPYSRVEPYQIGRQRGAPRSPLGF